MVEKFPAVVEITSVIKMVVMSLAGAVPVMLQLTVETSPVQDCAKYGYMTSMCWGWVEV